MKNIHDKTVKKYLRHRFTWSHQGRAALLSTDDLVNLLGISPRTARHYAQAPDNIPPTVAALLNVLVLGIIPGFTGATIKDGVIRLDTGDTYTPDQLQALTYVYQEVTTLRRRVKQLERQKAHLEENRDYWRAQAGEKTAINDEYEQ